MSLKGKSALVTGSTSGIGQAIAEAFAAQGCNVMLNGFGAAAAIETLRADMARKHGVRVEYNGADMRRPAEIADLVAGTKAAFGGVAILVNNAGIQYVAPIEQFPAEKWDAIIAINLSATFHAIHEALPKVAYVAAKHGIVGLTKVVGGGVRRHRRDLQRDLPRLGDDAAGPEADRGPRDRAGHPCRVRRRLDRPVEPLGDDPKDIMVLAPLGGEGATFGGIYGPAPHLARHRATNEAGGESARNPLSQPLPLSGARSMKESPSSTWCDEPVL